MTPRLISQEIEVKVSGELKVPTSFYFDGREYLIADVLEAWHDYGFGLSSLRRGRWWQRRHRNYYRVKTNLNEVFEIYWDRGTSLKNPERKRWILYRQL